MFLLESVTKATKSKHTTRPKRTASFLRCMSCDQKHIACVYQTTGPCNRCLQDLGAAARKSCLLLSAEKRRMIREQTVENVSPVTIDPIGPLQVVSPFSSAGMDTQRSCVTIQRKMPSFESILSQLKSELEQMPISRYKRRANKCQNCATMRIPENKCDRGFKASEACSRCRHLNLLCIPKFNGNVVVRSDILDHKQNLVECDSDPKRFFKSAGPRLLLYAAKHGNSRIVELLLEAGIDVESSDLHGRTSLHLAAAQQEGVVRTLLRENASVKSRDEWGRSPLHYAADNVNTKTVSILLSAGADVNASSVSSHTVLHYAVANLHTALVQLLLAAGADPNSTASWQLRTPLHVAARVGHLEGVNALLAANADPNSRDRFGATPLHQAAEWGNCGIIDALVVGGADISMNDHCGLNPMEEALNRDRKDVAQILFKYWLEFVPFEIRVSYSIETMSLVELRWNYWRLKDMLLWQKEEYLRSIYGRMK